MFRKRPTWKAVPPMTQEEEKDTTGTQDEPTEAPAEDEGVEAPRGKGKREKPLHDAAGNYIGPRREA
jgi:hypothetical protein